MNRVQSRRSTGLRCLILLPAVLVLSSACASLNPKKSAANSSKNRGVDTVLVKDPGLERRIASLELRLLEKEAQVEDLEVRLVDARTAVVKAMGKAQTATSRAEAASGMAEAEVALQSMRTIAGLQVADGMQVNHLVRQSSVEFDKRNYGGALYLANQAKALVTAFRARASSANRDTPRPGETAFAMPIRIKVESKGNIREGPGTNFGIAFGVESGSVLTAFSYTEDWIRVNDDRGRNGWIFRGLVGRP
jgi:hypothetical protein